jgi:hypothetical protein
MNDYVFGMIDKYRRKGVLVDTNILLLYVVGSFDREIIPEFKHTNNYTVEDFDAAVLVIESFDTRATTPNVLTEVSNLTGHLSDHLKGSCFDFFAQGITLLNEHYLLSGEISANPEFRRFGLTDAGIVRLAKNKYLVLTDDLPLYHYLINSGIDALNFNHIRTFFW